MGTPLKSPPVYLTLAQVRFNPILTLSDFLRSIQESFRQAGYPDFESQSIISIQITAPKGQSLTPIPVQQDKFLFGNIEKTHSFILDAQSLTLQSTHYSQFETFSDSFQVGLNIVNNAVELAFIERVGLRYLDRVMPQPGESIKDYLVEQVHGLNSRLGGRSHYAYTEAMNEIGKIKLLSRIAIQAGPLAFPPDIHLGNMKIAERFMAYLENAAILDNDGFVESREAFATTTVAKHLDDIHTIISDAFKATVSAHALAAWDK